MQTDYQEAVGLSTHFSYLALFQPLLTIPGAALGRTVSAARGRAIGLLDDLGLSERRDHFPRELSIGEQQRVAVARTLATAPGVVLADEPTGCVDPDTGACVTDLLVSFARKHGGTVVVATHGAFDLGRGDVVYRLESGLVQRLS